MLRRRDAPSVAKALRTSEAAFMRSRHMGLAAGGVAASLLSLCLPLAACTAPEELAISGEIFFEGKPAVGAAIALKFPDGFEQNEWSGKTDENGAFSFTVPHPFKGLQPKTYPLLTGMAPDAWPIRLGRLKASTTGSKELVRPLPLYSMMSPFKERGMTFEYQLVYQGGGVVTRAHLKAKLERATVAEVSSTQ
jgi:hypothetical protein